MAVESTTRFNPLGGWGLLVRNSKCFGDQYAGFDFLQKVNVIVGQNNAGKSTLLDLIACASIGSNPKGRDGMLAEVRYQIPFDWDSVESSRSGHSIKSLERYRKGYRALAIRDSDVFKASKECAEHRNALKKQIPTETINQTITSELDAQSKLAGEHLVFRQTLISEFIGYLAISVSRR